MTDKRLIGSCTLLATTGLALSVLGVHDGNANVGLEGKAFAWFLAALGLDLVAGSLGVFAAHLRQRRAQRTVVPTEAPVRSDGIFTLVTVVGGVLASCFYLYLV